MWFFQVTGLFLLVGYCFADERLKCYSCMFPDDSWCKDTANLKYQDATKTQQICPDHVKQCGYSEIVDDVGNEMVFRTCGGELNMDTKCEIFDQENIKTTVCYCGTSLCNSSNVLTPNLFISLLYIIIYLLS